ncbi:MAG: hypothetical protein AAFX80_22755 [Cyanobacteria bacterium J06639_18]
MNILSSREEKMASDRITLAPLGEYYNDLLTLDSWINGRTKGMQGTSLLSAKLQEREQRIKDRIKYLAEKRGIAPEDLWQQVLNGTADKNNEE